MNIQAIVRAAIARLRAPAPWAAVVTFEIVWIVIRRITGVPMGKIGGWEFYVPALFLLGHVALAPAPWQWSGRQRNGPGPWRGGLQALIWNSAWVALLLWGVKDVVRPKASPPVGMERPEHREGPPSRAAEPPPRPEDQPPGREEPPPRPEGATTPKDAPPPPARRQAEPNRQPPPGLPQELNLLLLNLPFALVVGWFMAGKERAEAREEELMEKEQQARALALQAQLHPHALYNVLGGLAELVHEDPDATEAAIVGLVELLRMLTRNGSVASLPLGQERALLKRYLSIESIRLGDRLRVKWDWPEWADALDLPPLLLQPLVENAVKHGISVSPAGGELTIAVRRQQDQVVLVVSNTGGRLDAQAVEGTGLSNLRERLALRPSLAGTLEIGTAEGRTVATVRLSLPGRP